MILALDPGIDVTGYAVLRIPLRPILTPQQGTGLLAECGSLRTTIDKTAKKTDDLLARVLTLSRQLLDLVGAVDGWGRELRFIVIERPSIGGTYWRHTHAEPGKGFRNESEIHARLAPMHLATGALAVTSSLALRQRTAIDGHPRSVEFVTAGSAEKKDKPMILGRLYPEFMAKSNEDERDAVWLGLSVLTSAAWTTRLREVARC